MWFVEWSRFLSELLRHNFFKVLCLTHEDSFDIIFFHFLWTSNSQFSVESHLSHLLFLLFGFDISDHARQISEETFRMVIDIILFLLVDSQIILFICYCCLGIDLSLFFKEFDVKPHHYFLYLGVHFLDKRVDNVLVRIQFVETADTVEEFNKLIMNLSLILWFFLFLFDLSFQYL